MVGPYFPPQRFGEEALIIIIVLDWVVFKETTWKMKTKGSFSLYLLKFCPTKHSKQVGNDPSLSLSMWRLQPASFCFVIYVVSFSLIRDHMVIAYAEKNHHKSCIIISSRLVTNQMAGMYNGLLSKQQLVRGRNNILAIPASPIN